MQTIFVRLPVSEGNATGVTMINACDFNAETMTQCDESGQDIMATTAVVFEVPLAVTPEVVEPGQVDMGGKKKRGGN